MLVKPTGKPSFPHLRIEHNLCCLQCLQRVKLIDWLKLVRS